MTEQTWTICGHPLADGGTCQRQANLDHGCGWHPVPQRPLPVPPCECERPLLLSAPEDDGLLPRCWRCARPIPTTTNGGPPVTDTLDDEIRRRAGRIPPDPRTRAALAAGLDPALAERLEGNTPEELAADAERLAGAVAKLRGSPDGSAALDDLIRHRATGAPPPPADDEPRHTSFDGGAREGPPPEPPGMDALIRGRRTEAQMRMADEASAFDRIASHPGEVRR